MKCMICGGQTLPGAKLCLPCRAALRRARDDTISELLPLPRRREAFAYSHSPEIGRAAPLAPTMRPATDNAGGRRGRGLTSAQLHAVAVVAFVAAAGVLTFVMTRELQRDRPREPAAATAPVAPAEPHVVTPRVSPSTMLGTAREESAPPIASPVADTDFIAPTPVDNRKPDHAAKPRTVTKAPVVLDPLPASSAVEAPVIVAAPPSPPPAPVAALPAAPDKAQLFAAALARCTGDFFTRTGCEHRARAQYCEGQWGQHPQCPAGVANDHGQ